MACKVAITLAVAFSAVLAAATIDKRIVGGEPASPAEFPFFVILPGKCAGSLLDNTTVLTAAHCALDFNDGKKRVVRAGMLDSETGGVVAEIAYAMIHPKYWSSSWKPKITDEGFEPNDIAIVKLSTVLEKSETIDYATLPANGSDPVANSTSIVAGWGAQGDWTQVDGKFYKAILPIHKRDVCSTAYPGEANRDTIVCAGGDGKSSSKGDSGGPLIDQETRHVIGITSFGRPDRGLTPGVFTRVGAYIPFIHENLGALLKDELRPKPKKPAKAPIPMVQLGPAAGPQCNITRSDYNETAHRVYSTRFIVSCSVYETQLCQAYKASCDDDILNGCRPCERCKTQCKGT